MKKKGKKLTPSQARIYRRGLARGKVITVEKLRRQRKAAARKAAATRAERRAAPRPRRPEPAEVEMIGVDALMLYEAPDVEGVPILSGLSFSEFVDPTSWSADVELWIEGRMVASETLSIAAEWDNEPASKTIRREIRSWYEGQVTNNPSWRESPAATLIRLSLRRT